MAGKPGRKAPNRIPDHMHLIRGTWRKDRHGPRPPAITVAASPCVDPLPPAVSEGLSGRGLTFVEQCWTTYSGWTVSSLVLLRETGQVIDALERLRGDPAERAAQRMLVQLLAALQLEA